MKTLSNLPPGCSDRDIEVAAGAFDEDDQAKPCQAALDSPALTSGMRKGYPANYRGRVPWKVRMACTVRPDMPFLAPPGTVALADQVYEVWVNSYGAVSAICANGTRLGLKPAEFDVVAWHGE